MQVLDHRRSAVVPNPCLVTGTREQRGRQSRREVEQRARHGGDRDRLKRGGVGDRQRPDTMDHDARARAPRGRRHRDLGRRRSARQQPQQMRGGPVADDGAGAAGEDGCGVVRLRRTATVAYGVHAVMHAVQAPVGEPALDRVPVHSLVDELLPAHVPVPPRRESCGRVEAASHTEP
jgi:hypothetical protein